ncbi:MAG: peptidylprolyl isomerase [Pseudomonadota bacterium]
MAKRPPFKSSVLGAFWRASTRGLAVAFLVALALIVPAAASAQSNPFQPVISVNNFVITQWELDQRARILTLFRSPGVPAEEARRALIDERLQLDAAAQLGISVPLDAVEAGMEEFAARTDLGVEEFLAELGAAGVSEETFRDFVRAGVTWREVVSTRFGPRAQVTEAEVDRALALTSRRGGAEVLISEIIIPARNPEEAARAEAIADDISRNVTSVAGFSARAREVSAAPTRANGGRLPDPVPVSNLPPQLRAQILTLPPGGVSNPIPLAGAVAVFQLRDLRETGLAEADNVSLEFARYLIPGGGTAAASQEAARVVAAVDTCDDLFGVNKGQPDERLVIETRAVEDIPSDLALELARLDEGETSTAIVRNGTQVVLMLCGRTEIRDEEVDRAAVRRGLIDQRLAAYADGFLAELRADAIIREE